MNQDRFPARERVNVSISFEQFEQNQVRTLSTNSNGAGTEGLLYVPDLDPSDPCIKISSQYVPNNVTRRANLPTTQYTYVGFAPWISAPCTQSYLAAAANSASAFLFYVPDNGSNTPPPINDPTWDLHDGGQWKSQFQFPVFAIPGHDGAYLMQQLALYSGNMSTVPNGIIIAQEFNSIDYVRVYSTFNANGAGNLPTLWSFLLIVLGIVIVFVGATSFSMHYVQRRNRRALEARVAAGEIDLETLGVKRWRHVSQAAIDALPLIIYTPEEKKPPLPLPVPEAELSTATEAKVAATSPKDYNQPTCPICLEDYIPGTTTVRSLPCHHIYHPDCIDPHLMSSSSLCPVCKARALSPDITGYNGVPITNVMVRRERQIRRRRERGEPSQYEGPRGQWNNFQQSLSRRLGFLSLGMGRPGGNRISNPTPAAAPTASQVEMGAMASTAPANVETPTASHRETGPAGNAAVASPPLAEPATGGSALHAAPPTNLDTEERREWRRRRASALLGRPGGLNLDEEERATRAGRSKCESTHMRKSMRANGYGRLAGRKAFGAVFPGFQ